MRRIINIVFLVVFVITIALSGCEQSSTITIKIGFFPNLTHSQAIYGYANGDFEKAFGDQYQIKWQSFNAGPAEIEAIFAGEVDIGYIGPIPAINGYIKSSGDVKIIAGATLNGALLVTRKGSAIQEVKDLDGRTIAVPQSNPDMKTLMDKGDIDAALVPEPWAARLINEIGVNVLLDSDEVWDTVGYSSAVIVVNTKFYEKNADLVKLFLQTHIEITEYINKNPEEAMIKINDKIGELTGSKLSDSVLKNAFSNMIVTFDPSVLSVNKFMTIYQDEGIVKSIPNKNKIYDFEILNELLRDKHLNEIRVEP